MIDSPLYFFISIHVIYPLLLSLLIGPVSPRAKKRKLRDIYDTNMDRLSLPRDSDGVTKLSKTTTVPRYDRLPNEIKVFSYDFSLPTRYEEEEGIDYFPTLLQLSSEGNLVIIPKLREEVADLQSFFRIYLFAPLNQALRGHFVVDIDHSYFAGDADISFHNNVDVVHSSGAPGAVEKYGVGEIKLDWKSNIGEDNFIEKSNAALQKMISEENIEETDKGFKFCIQLYSYMILNKMRHGVMSSFATTRIVTLDVNEEGKICLLVSQPFDRCHIVKVFMSFGLMCKDNYEENAIWFEKNSKVINKEIKKEFSKPEDETKQGRKGSRKSKSEKSESVAAPTDDLGRFINDSSIFHLSKGYSKCVINGKKLFIKTIDTYKHQEKYDLMMNEVSIYSRLKHLQGIALPTIVSSGSYCNNLLFGIVMEDVGTSFDNLGEQNITNEMKRGALKALDLIHGEGVCHKDIALRNILCIEHKDGSVTVKFVDFETAIVCNCVNIMRDEKLQLKAALGLSN